MIDNIKILVVEDDEANSSPNIRMALSLLITRFSWK
jgi:hypothetical protein